MDEEFNPYKALQVDPEADQEVIQAAYRRLARKYHPDVAPGPEAAARMVAINRAWELVGDPVRRAEHDRSRRGLAGPQATGPAAQAGATSGQGGRPGAANDRGGGPGATGGPSGAGGGPPGNVLNFGRYAGWSLEAIARQDPEYLEWLDRAPIGRPYRDQVDALLRRAGRRRSPAEEASERRGLFRRR